MDTQNRAVRCREVIDELEADMEYLGITGVEDKLQEDVGVTIESLRNAGVQIWMLTGDKIETAQCIAISTALKSPDQTFFVIRECTDSGQLGRELNEFGTHINNKVDLVLVIDGISLATALAHHEATFFGVSTKAKTVVCCRCSPEQKSIVTECIKTYTGAKTLGIGDGGNDVGMIQSADIGVGIVGKEGKQAALASDFSITKFKYLANLLLWHGRNSYKRGSVMAQFVMHRGLIISIMQTLFSMMYYYVAIPIFNGFLMLGYTTVFTTLPVFALVTFFP